MSLFYLFREIQNSLSQKNPKKAKKISKKVLTRGEESGIIIELSQERRRWSLKIEQQEMKYKA